MGLFGKKEKVESEKQIPSAEQIIEDAKNIREEFKDEELEESEIPDIICTIYSASQNIELDVDYVKEILEKSKNENN